jgi:proteasome accessory factor B
MHPLERLVKLVILLLDTSRPLTFSDIREKLPAYAQEDVSAAKRMFERDKDVLRDLGIPVELAPTDVWDVEEGYLIPKDRYYLPEIQFTPEELSALYVAAHTLGADDEAEQAVRKLQAGAGEGILAGLPSTPVAAGPDVPGTRLGQVARAIEDKRSIQFGYRPATGKAGRRHVDPYALVTRAGQWYVVGMDRDRGDVRSFRMSRFLSEVTHGGPGSEAPEGFDAGEHLKHGPWGVGEPEVEARMAFSPDVAWWAVRGVAQARQLRARGDGWVEVALPAARGDSFVAWALTFGPDAEVLGPPELRKAIIRRLEGLLADR